MPVFRSCKDGCCAVRPGCPRQRPVPPPWRPVPGRLPTAPGTDRLVSPAAGSLRAQNTERIPPAEELADEIVERGVEPQRIGHGFLSQTRGDAGADRAGGRGRSTASDPIPRRWLAAHRRRIPIRSLPCGQRPKPGSCAAWTPQPPESSTSAPHRRSWPRCGRSPAPGPR